MLQRLAPLAIAALATSAQAADVPVNLRFSMWLPPAHALTIATKAWADDIAKQSAGAGARQQAA